MESYNSSSAFLLTTFLLFTLLLAIRPTKSLSTSNADKLLLPAPGEEEFHEELYIQTLSDGFINSHFQFSTRWRYGQKENRESYLHCSGININIYNHIYIHFCSL